MTKIKSGIIWVVNCLLISGFCKRLLRGGNNELDTGQGVGAKGIHSTLSG